MLACIPELVHRHTGANALERLTLAATMRAAELPGSFTNGVEQWQ
jgi:hypothetical protein